MDGLGNDASSSTYLAPAFRACHDLIAYLLRCARLPRPESVSRGPLRRRTERALFAARIARASAAAPGPPGSTGRPAPRRAGHHRGSEPPHAVGTQPLGTG